MYVAAEPDASTFFTGGALTATKVTETVAKIDNGTAELFKRIYQRFYL